MKHSAGPSKWPAKRLFACLMLPLSAFLILTVSATAVTPDNPYSGIVERNSFGLKPPVNPADLVKPPAPVVADIKLQGITTILGRKQVLMKVKVPAKPPEPARDESLVVAEGDREGEIEVIEINPLEETVKVNNAGTILALNMKDHSEKPSPGAVPAPGALPGALPAVPSATGNPALLRPSNIPAPANSTSTGGSGVSTFGGTGTSSGLSSFGGTTPQNVVGSGTQQKSLPSRALRSSPGMATPQTAGGEFQNISPEAQAILIEAQRAQIQPGGFDPLPKTAITPREHMGTPNPPNPGQPR
ncbi:MAG TPA: hypothetical protein VFZ59_13270 [Verrucomicrobiae bacterium]|nr:hypothetical protein [Verrucomicrobiae bacterium]